MKFLQMYDIGRDEVWYAPISDETAARVVAANARLPDIARALVYDESAPAWLGRRWAEAPEAA